MSNNGNIESIREELNRLSQKLQEKEEKEKIVRSRRDELNSQVKKISAEIRALKEKYFEVREQLNKIRVEKNEMFEKIKALNEEKKKLIKEIRDLKKQHNEAKENLRSIRETVDRNVQRMNPEEIKSKIMELEWEYQTKTLTLEEEKYYMDRIKNLEMLYLKVKMYNDAREKISLIRSKMSENFKRIEEINRQLEPLLEDYVRRKKEVNKLRTERDHLKGQIEKLLKEKEEIRQEANSYHEKLLNIAQEKKEIKDELERVVLLLKAQELSRKIEQRRKRLYSRAQLIYEKYKRGEKLTLEEFKILMEFNMIPK